MPKLIRSRLEQQSGQSSPRCLCLLDESSGAGATHSIWYVPRRTHRPWCISFMGLPLLCFLAIDILKWDIVGLPPEETIFSRQSESYPRNRGSSIRGGIHVQNPAACICGRIVRAECSCPNGRDCFPAPERLDHRLFPGKLFLVDLGRPARQRCSGYSAP